MRLILLLIITTSSRAVPYDCVTPTGAEGACVPIARCTSLRRLLQNIHRSAEETRLLVESQCGLTTPKVCCEEACLTPDGDVGECVDVNECETVRPVLRLPKPLDPKIITYVTDAYCGSRFDVCCSTSTPSILASAEDPLLPPSSECGLSVGEDRIVGGEETRLDDYPWLALVERRSAQGELKVYCGATLISRRYLLTAAHCYDATNPPVSVRLGEYDVNNNGQDCEEEAGGFVCTDGAVSIPIETFTLHPEYNFDRTGKNDIAVVRMAYDVPETRFISPICLPRSDSTIGLRTRDRRFLVAGWGLTESQRSSDKKRHVIVPFVENDTCDREYRSRSTVDIWERQLCAGEEGKDSCNGDSGGPLLDKRGRQFELIGIVSFGTKKCGAGRLPGVYTKVFPYLGWIKGNMRP